MFNVKAHRVGNSFFVSVGRSGGAKRLEGTNTCGFRPAEDLSPSQELVFHRIDWMRLQFHDPLIRCRKDSLEPLSGFERR
jgi:hypothetical protein